MSKNCKIFLKSILCQYWQLTFTNFEVKPIFRPKCRNSELQNFMQNQQIKTLICLQFGLLHLQCDRQEQIRQPFKFIKAFENLFPQSQQAKNFTYIAFILENSSILRTFCVAQQIQNKMAKKGATYRNYGRQLFYSFGETSPQGGLRAKGDMKRQGEGGYPKNQRFGETSFMDGPQYVKYA